MTKIAYVYDSDHAAHRRGIFQRATELKVRIHAFQTGFPGANFKDILELAHPDAYIVESDYITDHKLTPGDFTAPVVVCDILNTQLDAGFTGIQYARETAVREVMTELFKLHLPNYAFVGHYYPHEWSLLRQKAFAEIAQTRGMTPLIFSCKRRKLLPDFMQDLEKWLLTLPHPCGILAVDDEIGDYVLTCANRLGIQVPDSLAVIGIDNDVVRCENTLPPLASIQPDTERSGRLAVELALKMIEHPSVLPPPLSYGSGMLIARESMRRFRRHDSAAAKALEFIRVHAADRKLNISSVAREMGMPISTARLRFQKYTGHTIFEEIENQRFLVACALLQNRDEKTTYVHKACGYGCSKALRNVFMKRTGLTPSEWRAQHI